MNYKNEVYNLTIGSRKGQALYITLMVMFILVFLGGIFASLLGKSISSTTKSGDMLTAEYLAEAGIRFAGDQLNYGNSLADWRPIPEYPEVLKIAVTYIRQGKTVWDVDKELKRRLSLASSDPDYLTSEQVPIDTDPDREWLLQGYCRFNYGKGRFMLRLTYEPQPNDPLSKFIKIESIGRMGVVDKNDPTTLAIKQTPRSLRYKVAYKAIGITDYARFITNKYRVNDDFPLGTPGYIRTTRESSFGQQYVTQFGEKPADGQPVTYGAPIRCNGNLLWNGINYLWLNPNTSDAVEVAGDIKYSVRPYRILSVGSDGSIVSSAQDASINPQLYPWVYVNGKPALDSAATAVGSDGTTQVGAFNGRPDDTTASETIGNWRDGRPDSDYYGRARNITRLDPPVIDASEITGGLNVYRDVTRNSGIWKQKGSDWFNTGQYGWGNGLYINNPDDLQPESSTYTLRGDWTKPGGSKWWNGSYYVPPGVNIELTPYDLDGTVGPSGNKDVPELVITHDTIPGQPQFQWHDADGNVIDSSGERIVMPYPKNGVIFAEGNVRIKGTLPPGVQLTVVSMGTVYVEGNILKYPFNQDGTSVNEGSPRNSSISLLARGNVCVNSTQFFGPSGQVPTAETGADYFDISPEKAFWMAFSFGTYKDKSGNSKYVYADSGGTTQMSPIGLYVRHSNDPTKAGFSYTNMLINYWTDADLAINQYFSLYNFTLNGTSPHTQDRPDYVCVLGDATQLDPGNWRNDVYNLWQNGLDIAPPSGVEVSDEVGENGSSGLTPLFRFFRQPGISNRIAFQIDQSAAGSQGISDYRLARAAVQPCDIRIEALMYAENGSFFIIPGEWFNPDTADSEPFMSDPTNPGARPNGVNPRYPYYGQPLDVRIVIYGAVAENVPASVGDASAWMEKWGWIPPVHGSSNAFDQRTVNYREPLNPNDKSGEIVKTVTTTNPINTYRIPILQKGLSFVYDRQLSCPRVDPMNSSANGIRYDEYGRMLPITPKLPVSTQTLYFGEPT